VVTNAERGEDEDRFSVTQLDAEDHSEFAVGEGETDLDAMQERRSAWSLLVAGAKFLHGDAAFFEAASSSECDLSARVSGSLQILGEGRVVEQRRGMTGPLVAHRLPLAVGGLHCAMLGLEVGQGSWLGAETLADRCE
jgi:hypothetical protein